MENYEQKYKHAIEQAKKELKACGSMDCDAARQIFRFFPELEKIEEDKIIDALKLAVFSYGSPIHNYINTISKSQLIYWLEKQSKQEQLYIRFGEIPTNEKSKIYQGEVEVGTENGVSVYPAFKTNKGDIVLGLNLPITKTTLYTQQHLIEYDDRPCYLVKGTYVGKDTDGQSLINNISIIEKIDGYKIKEEKRDEQNPIEKVGSKFKVGDWIVNDISKDVFLIKSYSSGYCTLEDTGGKFYHPCLPPDEFHLWTIQDASDGDILTTHLSPEGDWIGIFKERTGESFTTHCFLASDGEFVTNVNRCNQHGIHGIHPATKEQRDLLLQKMKEAGWL